MKKISKKYSSYSAFTMLELVFVIVVIGILASMIIPNTKTNPLQEAAMQVVSHIKYTQHLAMVDDKYSTSREDDDNNSIWFKERWQLVFGENDNSGSVPGYTIFSDTAGNSTGDAQESEIARNPQNSSQRMTGGTTGANVLNINHDDFVGMKKMNLGLTYGITAYELSVGCSNARIAFDHLGRPMQGDMSSMTTPYVAGDQRLIIANCDIILSHGADDITIRVAPETGFTCVLNEGGNCI